MPSNFMSLDDFPTFTGQESPKEQIQALHNYLFVMREQLVYMLQNLSIDNWNASALQTLTEGTQAEFVKTLQTVSGQLSQLKSQVDSLSGRVSGTESLSGRILSLEENMGVVTVWAAEHEAGTADLPKRMTDAETAIAQLQAANEETDGAVETLAAQVEQNQIGLGELDGQINGETGLTAEIAALSTVLSGLRVSLDALAQAVQTSDTAVTVGRDGKELRLVGTVYINGVLYEQEDSGDAVT